MASQKGLGRGLGALLGDFDQDAAEDSAYKLLPLHRVEPNPDQPRQDFDEEELAALAESIRVHGVLQPLTVRETGGGYYQIIAGERRWRAAKLAGLAEVPAVIIEADDRKVMELGLIENLQREDLNPAEEARGYQVLMEEYGLTQEQVAQRMGKSRPAITNMLRLLALPQDVLALVEEEQLSAGHARAILAAPTADLQRQNLVVSVVEQPSSEAEGTILNQEPAAGTQVRIRSTVRLYVATAMPEVVQDPSTSDSPSSGDGAHWSQEITDANGNTWWVDVEQRDGHVYRVDTGEMLW